MENSLCFIGHRKIENTSELREKLRVILYEYIQKGVVNFIFGDHSAFNDICYEIVTELKEKFPAIKRIYFRKDYEDADEYTMQFLIKGFEESVCPKGVGNAGRASYVERNQAMIRESEICIFYYNENYRPSCRTISGTARAYLYAVNNKKTIVNCFLM